MARNRRHEEAHTQCDSTAATIFYTAAYRVILKLTHQGQHRVGAESDIYHCLVVCAMSAA